jgi:hypothetical protein
MGEIVFHLCTRSPDIRPLRAVGMRSRSARSHRQLLREGTVLEFSCSIGAGQSSDVFTGTNHSGTNPPLGGYQGRFAYGPRLPLPYRRTSHLARSRRLGVDL